MCVPVRTMRQRAALPSRPGARGTPLSSERRIISGHISDDDVTQHFAVVRPTTPLAEISPKDRLECVLVGHTEHAERTDQHVQVEWIHFALNGALCPTTLKNSRDELHRPGIDAGEHAGTLNMFGTVNVLDGYQAQELRVAFVVIESQLRELT